MKGRTLAIVAGAAAALAIGAGQSVASSPRGAVVESVNCRRHPHATACTTTTSTLPTTTRATTTTLASTTTQPTTTVPTGSAFTEDFSGPNNTVGNRNGDLSVAKFSVSRWRDELSSDGNAHVSAGPAIPGDSAVVNGQAVIQVGSQNYGDTSVRINQPFDIAGRTGTVKFDASLFLGDGLWGWTTFGFFSDPYNAPGYQDDNAAGATAAEGFSAYFQDACGMPRVRAYHNHVETDYSSGLTTDCSQLPSTAQGKLNRVEVRVSQSHVEIWASNASADGVTFGPLRQIFARDIALSFSRGFLYFGGHNHASLKYGGPPTWTTYWDNMSFDGPAIASSGLSQVNDSGTEPFGWGLPQAPTMTPTLSLPDVTPGAAARLLLNVAADEISNANFSAWRLNYRLNGGTIHAVAFDPALAHSFLFSIPVDPAELVQGANTVQFSGVGMYAGYQPYLANIDLVVTGAGSPPPTTTTSPTSTTVVTTTSSSTTTSQPTTTLATTTTAAGAAGCGLAAPAFCETFDAPQGDPATRSGDLDPSLWGVSRIGGINPGSMNNTYYPADMIGCGNPTGVLPPATVRICNGHLFDVVNDHTLVMGQAMYPKQPFNIAGRTGRATFDVSNDSQGTHAAWPEWWFTDQPVPVPGDDFPVHDMTARNAVGVSLAASNGQCVGVDAITVIRNYALEQVPFTSTGCNLTSAESGPLNHYEIRISNFGIEVWGTDPGSATLKQIAVSNTNVTITQGVVWIEDDHYNAEKGGDGSQQTHTFKWDNVGFDGPKTYRDLTFDVQEAHQPAGDGGVSEGWLSNSPVLSTTSVHWDHTPVRALVTFNFWGEHLVVPSLTLNGHSHSTAWPFPDQNDWTWRTLAVEVPFSEVAAGANQIQFSTSDFGAVANVNLSLIDAANVP